MTIEAGVFTGVGVGPGDPELLTLKAYRLISEADAICYLVNTTGESQAKNIAVKALEQASNHQVHIPIVMPMSVDRRLANQAYGDGAQRIRESLMKGLNVVFLCEGDPLFFGSFAYLLERLQTEFTCQSVAGISSFHAASSALLKPLAALTESYAVVSGRHDLDFLVQTLNTHESVVIMKAGRSRQRILEALILSGRKGDASYLEYVGRDNQRIIKNIETLDDEPGPYFSLFIVVPRNRQLTDDETINNTR